MDGKGRNGGRIPTSSCREFVALTVIYPISVSGGTPRRLSTLKIEGDYISAHEVDGINRVVMSTAPAAHLPFLCVPYSRDAKKRTENNKKVISNTIAEDWLPHYTLNSNNCNGLGRNKKSCKTKRHTVFFHLAIMITSLLRRSLVLDSFLSFHYRLKAV